MIQAGHLSIVTDAAVRSMPSIDSGIDLADIVQDLSFDGKARSAMSGSERFQLTKFAKSAG
jgi:hypothetical protein